MKLIEETELYTRLQSSSYFEILECSIRIFPTAERNVYVEHCKHGIQVTQ